MQFNINTTFNHYLILFDSNFALQYLFLLLPCISWQTTNNHGRLGGVRDSGEFYNCKNGRPF